jgi:hypothetical protein
MTMTKPTSEQVTFLAAGAGATQRTALSKFQDALNLADFGVVGDGITDDTAAFAAAIAAQQASGKILVGMAGKNANLASWTRITCSNPFYFDGQYMTVTCGNAISVEFIDCQNDFDIRNTDFQLWFRVLDCQKTTNRTRVGIFSNNVLYGRRKINPVGGATISNFAFQINIQNYFDDLRIENNTIENASVYGIHLGSQDAGFEDDVMYRRARVIGNRITNVNAGGGGPGTVYACIHQGHRVEYLNNCIENGDPVALGGLYGNGAYALYCKARYALVSGNYLKDIGTTTGLLANNEAQAINVKSAKAVIENNVIDNVGKPNDYVVGVAAQDQSPFCVMRNNYCTNVGGSAFIVESGGIIEGNNITLGITKRVPYPGVLAGSAQADEPQFVIANNRIITLSGHTATVTGSAITTDAFVLPDGANGYVYGNTVTDFPGTAFQSHTGVNNAPIRNLVLENNRAYGCSAGYTAVINTINGANDARLVGNEFESVGVVQSMSAGVGGIVMRDNIGFVTRNAGLATAISSGATVSHGLAGTPELVFVTPLSAGVTDITVTGLSSTTFVINFGGGGTANFAWDAQHPRYNGRV